MNTEDEIAQDQWYSEITEEISEQAIDEFTYERLRSYYIANPNVAVNSFSAYTEAKLVLPHSPSAALTLFVASIEVCLKSALLKPVIYGLVHNESAAEIISDLTVKNNGFDRIKDLLGKITGEYSGINLHEYKLEYNGKNIWNEMLSIQKARNAVVHRSELASLGQAQLAQSVAKIILGKFLPSVLAGLGLEIKDGFLIG